MLDSPLSALCSLLRLDFQFAIAILNPSLMGISGYDACLGQQLAALRMGNRLP